MKNITVNSVNGKLLGSFGRTGAMSIADKIKAAAAKASASGATSGATSGGSTPEVTSISSSTLKQNAKSGCTDTLKPHTTLQSGIVCQN